MTSRVLRANSQPDHQHVSTLSTGTILFLISAAALAMYELQWVLLPFVLSGVASYICIPVIGYLTAKTRLPRLVVAICAFLVVLGIGIVIGLIGVPPLLREMKNFTADFRLMIDNFARSVAGKGTVNLFGQQMDAQQLGNQITGAVRDWLSNARVITAILGSALMTTFGLFLTLTLLFFFMVSGPAIVRGLLWLIPPGQRSLIEDHILSNLDPVLRRYFIGVIAIVCFAAVFAYLGLGLVLAVPHAVFLAIVTGVLEAIPMVGPIAAAAIAGAIALAHNSGLAAIIGYGIYLAALRLSIDQLFGPIVLGAAGRVHPALIIFCFLAGGSLFGVAGVIMAVPVALVIKTTLLVLYDEMPSKLSNPEK